MKVIDHFRTITNHKILVMKHCFRVGLYAQGILHDLSKYSPTEFLVGCKYYQGHRSPNNAEREDTGLSTAWLHHKGRNKHHFEYWIDYNMDGPGLAGSKMPKKYVVEMFMDRVAASKNYLKENYKDSSALDYYLGGAEYQIIHPESKKLLEKLLHMLAEKGEEKTFEYIRTDVLKNKRKKRKGK